MMAAAACSAVRASDCWSRKHLLHRFCVDGLLRLCVSFRRAVGGEVRAEGDVGGRAREPRRIRLLRAYP